MTQPRLTVPGATVMVTRRTIRRTCLLRPDSALRQRYLYCLAVTAKKFGIEVHAVCLMSTHEHLILTDPRGERSLFLRDLHRLFALEVKLLRKWEGAVWDNESTSVVELLTPEAILEKIAYVIANPVAAGLVRRAADWPGLQTLPKELARKTWTASRPAGYLRPDDAKWPGQASLELTLPEALQMPPDTVRERVAALVREAEQEALSAVSARGRAFLGRRRVEKTSPYDRARSREPLRSRTPTFAVGREQRQAFVAAVHRLRAFRAAYRRAMAEWLAGARDVVFPYGTWAMQWHHRVAVGLPPI